MTRRTEYAGRNPDGSEIRKPLDQWEGDWGHTEPDDLTGRRIEPGMWLVRSYQSGRSCNLEIRQVRDVRQIRPGGPMRVFLDESRVPIEYPSRCLIIDWDPVLEAVRPRSGGVV